MLASLFRRCRGGRIMKKMAEYNFTTKIDFEIWYNQGGIYR